MIKLTVADVDCGVSKMAFRNGRIVNGLDVTEGEFPWYFIFKIYFLKLEMKSFLELLF